MFVGHYSAALAAKGAEPRTPLWTVVAGCQLIDIGWSVLVMAGVEKVRIDPSLPGSDLDLYYMPFTHSLPAAIIWSVAALVAARWLLKLPSRVALIIGLALPFLSQVSGINAIIYYAPRIFDMTGLGAGSSLLSTAGLGAVNFVFTLLAMNFIDRIGRRTLMLIGSFGLIITLALVSYSFYSANFRAVPIFLFVYIAFFAFSQGAVIWVFISEIFPNQVRAKGQTLGSTTHWVMAAIIAFTFPYLAEKVGGGNTFLFFCLMMFMQLLFVWKIMPETKGRSLEQIEHTLVLH